MLRETVEIRCGKCGRLLLKAAPGSVVETKCPRCKSMTSVTVRGDADKMARPDRIKTKTP